MAGRTWGVLALTVALAALIVGAGIKAHTVAGVAQIEPAPGPPAVGDCLTQPVPETGGFSWDLPSSEPTGAAPVTLARDLPEGVFAPCPASRFGEVVDVDPDPHPPTARKKADGIIISDPTWTRCAGRADAYLGVQQPSMQVWHITFGPSSTLVGPSQRQQDSGQHWSACVVVTPADGTTPVLDRSPRTLLTDGAARDQLGQCQATGSWSTGSTGGGVCGQPHRSETFGYADFSTSVVMSRDALTASCIQLIQRVTRLPGTALGAVFTGVHVFDSGSALDIGREPTRDSLVVCGVESVTPASLTHSLIAWGDRPLPLT